MNGDEAQPTCDDNQNEVLCDWSACAERLYETKSAKDQHHRRAKKQCLSQCKPGERGLLVLWVDRKCVNLRCRESWLRDSGPWVHECGEDQIDDTNGSPMW